MFKKVKLVSWLKFLPLTTANGFDHWIATLFIGELRFQTIPDLTGILPALQFPLHLQYNFFPYPCPILCGSHYVVATHNSTLRA